MFDNGERKFSERIKKLKKLSFRKKSFTILMEEELLSFFHLILILFDIYLLKLLPSSGRQGVAKHTLKKQIIYISYI
jgi:hypothetical protein